VLHGGRRWWYPLQSILSERSVQFESAAVWFIGDILRSHGYNHTNLECLSGRQVTPASWRFGDLVTPYSDMGLPSGSFGRIVPESRSPKSSLPPHSRESGTVFVEYIGKAFADAVGMKSVISSSSTDLTLEAKRIHTSKFVYSNVFHDTSYGTGRKAVAKNDTMLRQFLNNPDGTNMTENTSKEIAGLANFERGSIDALTKESKKSTDSLATLFSAGLPDSILAALSVAERQMNSLEPREDVADKILALGALTHSIAEQLFTDKKASSRKPDPDIASAEDVFSYSSDNEINTHSDRAISHEMSSRESNLDRNSTSATSTSSAQHRRNLLLSLMSRASRSRNVNDTADIANEVFGIDFPSAHFPSGLHDVPPFLFGAPNDMMDTLANEGRSSSHGRNDSMLNDQDHLSFHDEVGSPSLDSVLAQYTYLDSILRCRSVRSWPPPNGGHRQWGAAYAIFAQKLISSGVLIDSVDWTKAIVGEHCKKIQLTSMIRSSSCLRDLADEEGTPMLQLAIAFGCSKDLLRQLIGYGCTVGVEEIKKAAMTDQPETLRLLLQHTSYSESMINLSLCSPGVCRVLKDTKARQLELDKRMRESAGIFVIQMLRKLFKLCLSARGDQSTRLDQCCKAICEVLVGNVLLHALYRAQNTATSGTVRADLESTHEIADRSGRFLVHEGDCVVNKASSQGLLGLLPKSLLGECFLSEKQHLTQYMMVIEDYLYSKDLADIASGLTFVLVLLRNFPQLRGCSEMERFGVLELCSYHSVFTSSRIAELLSKQVTLLSVSTTRKNSPELPTVSEPALKSTNSVVLCPKKHTAVLHITRHSSFRCDLCGNGVERGRPMHGCRDCDWDACEDCTDRAECGVVKSSTVKTIASECMKLLEDTSTADDMVEDFEYSQVLQTLADENTSTKLNSLAVQLLQGDAQAAKELGILLNEQGKVSVHQFLTIILPSLHAALIGQHGVGSASHGNASHPSKKPRFADRRGKNYVDSSRWRLDYCRVMLRLLIPEREKVVPPAQLHTGIGLSLSSYKGRKVDCTNEDSENADQIAAECRDMAYSFQSSELLRRLHQVLSLNENVQIASSSSRQDLNSSKGGDLQALTKLLEIHLSPSACEPLCVQPQLESTVFAEPLLSADDLRLHVLRIYRPIDPDYLIFCERSVSIRVLS
jgi:hypothetical protein